MKKLPNTIVNLHKIEDEHYLRSILESVKENYTLIPLMELEKFYYEGRQLTNFCHITFDDGHASFYYKVLPLIKKYQVPVSIYVSPLATTEQKNFWFQEIEDYNKEKFIEAVRKVLQREIIKISPNSIYQFLKTLQLEIIWEIIRLYQKETNTAAKPFMNLTVDQLREIKSSGLVDIGAHTLNHPILKNESNEVASNEIENSIDDLGDILDCEIKYFAYPNGRFGVDFGMREMEILKNKQIKLAFSEEKGEISLSNNPLCVPRSGSPLVLQNNYKQSFKYPLFFTQLLLGEKRYYEFVKTIKRIKDSNRQL